MANTTVREGNVITIVMDAVDWSWKSADPNGLGKGENEFMAIESIMFHPGDVGDVLVMFEKEVPSSGTGARIFPGVIAADTTDDKILFCGGARMRPVIDITACTLSSGHAITITLSNK